MTDELGIVASVGMVLMVAACAVPTDPPDPPAGAPLALLVIDSAIEASDPLVPSAEATEPAAEPVAEVVPEQVPSWAASNDVDASAGAEPFEGRETVRLTELVAELERVADELAEAPAVRADYDAFVAAHGLADTDALYRDYVRVKLVFESTRDGGLWHLSWAITNEQPNSEQIWRQWKRAKTEQATAGDAVVPTAVAECDELSALFAFMVARLGVRHVGLFWPTWNHVVAVWTVRSEEGTPVRIVVPTSQIFLTADDSLGTTGFDPWKQRTIYEYRRRDVKGSHAIDAELARFFVMQARRYAGLPQLELQRLRNERDGELTAASAERGRG